MRKQNLSSALPLILFFSVLNANAASVISCGPRELISDSGFSVTIEKKGARFDYIFSKNTYSGPEVLSQKEITVEATKAGSLCRIHVSDTSKQKNKLNLMFNLERTGNLGKWNLVAPPGGRAPALVCEIEESLAKQLCASGYEPKPIPIVPSFDSVGDENGIVSSAR